MAIAGDRAAELRTLWEERGIVETELAVEPRGTIVQGAAPSTRPGTWTDLIRHLPRATGDAGPFIELDGEIGRGGMGLVRAGLQRSLGREVAIKSARPASDPTAVEALLREAWISGQLEHPNIIPVYALYRGDAEDDSPQLVMRRVEGGEWSLGADGVEGDLRTLAQVCHAVHFAHTRGIVHLDLKPQNIMLGGYGELYLLDWGIAMCLSDDFPVFLPRARDVRGVLGTPAYMAPELASGDGAAIGVHTDVYLLGAILHEILTGRPPHVRATLGETLAAAFTSEPPAWPSHVPAELAAIASRALARDGDLRFESVASFREALEDYLVHAASLSLATAAEERLRQILALASADHPEVDELASAAEFGFRQALDVWGDNTAARASLQRLLEHMIERDLRHQRWQLAERRLAELPDPRPDLEREARALRASHAETADALRRLRDDADLGMSAAQRSAMAYIGALLWALGLVGLGQLDYWGVLEATHWHMLLVTVSGTCIFAFMIHLVRREIFANAINRNAVALLSVGWILGDLYWVGAWTVRAPFEAAVVGVTPITVFVIAGHAASVDRRLVPHAIAAILVNVCVFLVPSWGLEVLGLGGGIVLIMLGATWRKPPAERPG